MKKYAKYIVAILVVILTTILIRLLNHFILKIEISDFLAGYLVASAYWITLKNYD